MPVHSTPNMMWTQVRNQRLGPRMAMNIAAKAPAAITK